MHDDRPELLRLPPARAVARVAGPMVVLGWVRSLYIVADTWWVGRLGDEALAGVAAASFGWWILAQVGDLAGTGVHALVARAEGAGTRGAHRATVASGAVVALAAWLPLALGAAWLVPAYLDALALGPGAVRDLADPFLVASVGAALAFALQAVVGGVFRGIGDTRTALAITAGGLVVNAALDPLLIWGAGPIPAFGVAGAAWATGLASGLSAVVGWVVLVRRGHVPRAAAPWGFARAREVARIGLPVTLSGVGFSLVYVALGRTIAAFGELHLAALGVGHRLESFTYLAAVGLQVAAATLVGQHLGAGDPEGAQRAFVVVRRTSDVAMLAGLVIAWLFAEPLYLAFAADPRTVEAGAVYLRAQAAVWVFMGWECVYEGAFTGAARTAVPAWIVGLGTLLRLPLAWALASGLGLGIDGVWLAIALSTALKGVALRVAWARLRPRA